MPTRRVKKGAVEIYELHESGAGRKNWGDHISAEIVSHFFDIKFKICTDGFVAGKTLVVGSVMNQAFPGDVIWGAGCIKPGLIGYSKGRLSVRAVRGPLTFAELRNRFNVNPIPFGDPALLVGQMYDLPETQTEFEYGVIPHYADYGLDAVQKLESFGVKIIDIRQSTASLLQDIAAVKKLLSSSLHGLILADAMGVPNCRVQFSNRVIGGDFKFMDYFLSVGREHYKHLLGDDAAKSKLDRMNFNDSINWNPELILGNAPWNLKSERPKREAPK